MRSMMAVMLLLGIPFVNAAQERRAMPRENAYNNDLLPQVQLYRPDIPVTTRPDRPGTPALVSGTVSVSDLEIPSKAAKEFERARAAFRKADLHGAAEHLEKAVARDPEWPAGHFELGRMYLRLNAYDSGIRGEKPARGGATTGENQRAVSAGETVSGAGGNETGGERRGQRDSAGLPERACWGRCKAGADASGTD